MIIGRFIPILHVGEGKDWDIDPEIQIYAVGDGVVSWSIYSANEMKMIVTRLKSYLQLSSSA